MLKLLIPNYQNFKVFPKDKQIFWEDFLSQPFILKLIKRSSQQMNFFLKSLDEEKNLYFLKLYLKNCIRSNRPKEVIKRLTKLEELKIPTLKPLLVFYQDSLFFCFLPNPLWGGVIYPYIEKGFLQREDFQGPLAKRILQDLVNFLFELHQKGVYLRDTKYKNFYLNEKGEFKVFDLDGIKFYEKPLTLKKRLKDLSALAMTLEWEGFKEAGETIFKTYQKFCPSLKESFGDYFFSQIQKRTWKRTEKIKKSI